MKRARRRIPPSFTRNAVIQPRYCLADLLLQMPEGAPIYVAWDAMSPVGREIEPASATLRSVRAMRRFMRKQQRKLVGRGIDLRRLLEDGRA